MKTGTQLVFISQLKASRSRSRSLRLALPLYTHTQKYMYVWPEVCVRATGAIASGSSLQQ